MKEGVSITRHPVTKPRPLLEQPPLPDQVPGLLSGGDVLVSVPAPHRVGGQQEVDHTRGTVTPVDQPVLVIPWRKLIYKHVLYLYFFDDVTFAGWEVAGVHLHVEHVVHAGLDELVHLGGCDVAAGLEQ